MFYYAIMLDQIIHSIDLLVLYINFNMFILRFYTAMLNMEIPLNKELIYSNYKQPQPKTRSYDCFLQLLLIGQIKLSAQSQQIGNDEYCFWVSVAFMYIFDFLHRITFAF